MLPKKIHILTEDLEILDAKTETQFTRAFISLNPHKDRIEYTDLSQVWHDAKEEPEKGKLMIGIDEDDVSIYKWVDQDDNWFSFAKWFGLTRWAYINDLLPKNVGDKSSY